ncbi:MAG: TIGR00341 family protein [Candidatus Thermoplasmatota archaeon]
MDLRLLEVYGLTEKQEKIEKLLNKVTIYGIWQEKLSDETIFTKILIDSEQTEPAIEKLEDNFSDSKNFRIIVLDVEASTPRPDKEEIREEEEKTKERVWIEEIYQETCNDVELSKTYFVLITLASVVAAIGILYNNIPVIIGSMVIAPMLSPSMALSLSTTLADSKLAKNAIITAIIGYTAAILIGILFGLFFTAESSAAEPLFRTEINMMYMLLALAAGVAGSLSFTRGISQSLVGVMVAVALLPPLVTSGLLIGKGLWNESIGAFLLFLVNMVGINLAGVLTFIIQGISPRRWWEKKKAKRTVIRAIAIWILFLVVLTASIYLYTH